MGWWIGVDGQERSIEAIVSELVDVAVRRENGCTALSSADFSNSSSDQLLEAIRTFIDRANRILVLLDLEFGKIVQSGPIYFDDAVGRRHHQLFVETANFEIKVFAPIIVQGTGLTAQEPARALSIREAEMSAQHPRFAAAATIMASAGDDLRELYKVAELIEKAHGGLPKKRSRTEREAFFISTQIDEADWDAFHRTARPRRHAEAHDMAGRTLTVRQSRALLQHALKLWIEREVPTFPPARRS